MEPPSSPYHPPQSPQWPPAQFSGQSPSGRSPDVWPWYVAYCIAMALLYVFVVILGSFFLLMPADLAAEISDGDVISVRIQGAIFLAVSLPLMLFFAAAPLLPKRRWAWIYGIVAIALGMTSLCCLPVTIPLLIFWVKPETRTFFQYAS